MNAKKFLQAKVEIMKKHLPNQRRFLDEQDQHFQREYTQRQWKMFDEPLNSLLSSLPKQERDAIKAELKMSTGRSSL